MIGAELDTAAEWIMQCLSADADLAAFVGNRIYKGVAPKEAISPFVVYAQHGNPSDEQEIAGGRLMTRSLWWVRVSGGRMSERDLRPGLVRIDAALHRSGPAVLEDGVIHGCKRVQPLNAPVVQDGVVINRVGGLYELFSS